MYELIAHKKEGGHFKGNNSDKQPTTVIVYELK